MMYKLYKTTTGQDAAKYVNEQGHGVSFLFDPDNTEYQKYLAWLAEGNTPQEADNVTN